MFAARWKAGYGFFHADAQTVAEEILSIGEEATAEQILEKARDESTELHKCFEWDDTIAAEKYRIYQAGKVIRLLVIERTKEEIEKDLPEIRVFQKTEKTEGYKPINLILQRPDEYKLLLQNAYNDLRAFRRKYQRLTELDDIFALIDQIA